MATYVKRVCSSCGMLLIHSRLSRQITRNWLQKSFIRWESNKLIQNLQDRGMLYEIHPDDRTELYHLLAAGQQTVYSGFDPTADSLHVGNLLIIMTLIHWQRSGHNVIAVVGGSTAKVGDPSERATEREVLDDQVIESNSVGIEENLLRIFDNHEKYFHKDKKKLSPIKILNNKSWYSNENVISFLTRVGRRLRVGQMLSRKSIKKRLDGVGLNFTEFSYQVFQSYDWLYLFDKYNCRIQIGGSDQLANIDLGHDLLKRVRNVNAYGLTVPLVTAESGDKFGKSAGNAVWLNETKTSPFDLYQFFMRLPDTSVEEFLKKFTFYSMSDVESILQQHMRKPDCWYAQKKIAENVTKLIHGENGLRFAKLATDALYNNSFKALVEMNETEMKQVFKQIPPVELLLEPGITIMDMAMKANCFRNKRDAERIITSGGMYINNQKVTTPNYVITEGPHILSNRLSLLRIGKRNYYLVKWL